MAKKMHIYYTDNRIEVREITKCPSLEEMQKIVGGYIERAKVIFKGRKCDMILNEDGMALGLPRNEEATAIYLVDREFSITNIIGILGNVIILEGVRL